MGHERDTFYSQKKILNNYSARMIKIKMMMSNRYWNVFQILNSNYWIPVNVGNSTVTLQYTWEWSVFPIQLLPIQHLEEIFSCTNAGSRLTVWITTWQKRTWQVDTQWNMSKKRALMTRKVKSTLVCIRKSLASKSMKMILSFCSKLMRSQQECWVQFWTPQYEWHTSTK